MIDALITGKLIRDPQLKTSATGTVYCQFLLSVSVNEPENIVVSGVAFGEVAERLAKLKKGDPMSVVGSLKPSEWTDKNTNEIKHGLSITANNVLTLYEIKKRKQDTP